MIIVLASSMQALCSFAQGSGNEERTDITKTTMLGIGATEILDTYISPEHYNGVEIRFIDNTLQRKTASPVSCDAVITPADYRRWSTDITHQAYLSFTSPRSDDNDNIAGLYTLTIGRHRHWDLLSNRLHLKAGAVGEAAIGFLYNTHNGNNPAQLRLGLNIAPSAAASYDFMAFGKRFSVDYGIQVPLLGVMFTPHYGQSYYEIFNRGNYDHNVVPTTFIATPNFRHQLSVEYNITPNTAITLGYLGDYQQANVNNLKSHIYAHRIMIGIVRTLRILNNK